MGVYLYLLYFVLFGTLISFLTKKKLDALFVLIAVCVVGVVALRNESLGVDTRTYCDMFLHPTSSYKDPGFFLYNSIIRLITNDRDWYIAITAILSIGPVMYVIWKDSYNKILSLFLFISVGSTLIYYVLYFAAMRQCLAVGMLFLLVHFVRIGKISNITIIVILNVMIGLVHTAALVFIPVFFLQKISFKKNVVCVVLAVSFVIGFNLKNYSEYVYLVNGLTNDRFDYYLSYVADSQYMMLATLPLMLIAILITTFGGDGFRNDLYYKMFICGVTVNNIMELAADSSRLTFIFLISTIIAIPNFIVQLNSRYAKIVRVSLLFLLLSYYSYKYIGVWDRLDPNANMIPYKTNSLI